MSVRSLCMSMIVVLMALGAGDAAGQIAPFTKSFKNIAVDSNTSGGVVIPFETPQGAVWRFWWGFHSTGWRDLHIKFVSPGGTALEQVAGKPWMDVSPIIGKEAGKWELRLTETKPGAAHNVNVDVGMMIARRASPDLPVTGTKLWSLSPADKMIVDWLRQNQMEAATLAVTRNGRLVYKRGYGWQDFNRTVPINPDAAMRLASNTKMITARAIQQLVETKRLSYSDAVYDVLKIAPWGGGPVADPRVRKITIRQLVDHQAGFGHDVPSPGALGHDLGLKRAATLNETIAWIWKQKLMFDPGTQSSYSNFGYEILAAVIEKASGRSYDDFIKTELAGPLGITTMRNAGTSEAEKAPNEIWYAGHGFCGRTDDCDGSKGEVADAYCTNFKLRPGAVSLMSSAPDYCRFLKSYFHNGTAKPVSLKGRTWSYTFYGSWPGTWSVTRDMINPDGTSISYVFLLNERNDMNEAALGQLVGELDKFFLSVKAWPIYDLFEKAPNTEQPIRRSSLQRF